ncbi:MAG: rhodanese-like domain-containing protein [Lysobacterales bacterium]
MALKVQDLVAAARAAVREIDAEQLLALQAGGAPVVDVREPAEYASGHLAGAVNIPRGVLEFEIDGHPAVNCVTAPALAHRERPLVLYCRSGGRSALAAEALQRLGFTDVRSLAGGVQGWTAAGRTLQA